MPRVAYHRQHILHLAVAFIEFAAAATHTAKIETQRDEVQFHKSFRQRRDDLVVHRAAHGGQRMRDYGDGARRFVRQVRDAFEISGSAGYGKFFQSGHLSQGNCNPVGRFKS